MVPGSQHDEVVVRLVILLERRISLEGPVVILLVPPATDNQRGHRRRFQIIAGTSGLPIIVVARMGDEGIPRRKLTCIKFGDLAERAFLEIKIVGVLIEGDVRILFRAFHHLHVFITVALTKGAIVKKVVA